MTIEHQTTVKSWFEAGDRPTEAQFASFIDSSMPEWSIDLANAVANGSTGVVSMISVVSATIGGLSGLGGGAVGVRIFSAGTTASAFGQLGAGAFGAHMFTTATTAAGLNALAGGAFGQTMFATSTTAAGRGLLSASDIVYADDYGCVPDGSDITAQFSAAYAAACVTNGTLRLRAGTYSTTGIKLAQTTGRWCTIEGESTELFGQAYHTIIQHRAGSTGPVITISANNVGGPQGFRNLVIDGNKTNTSGTYGIFVQSYASPPVGGQYFWGVRMENVQINNSRHTGLYIGNAAGGNHIRNCQTYLCGISAANFGMHIDSYDVDIDYININSSLGDGIYLSNTSQFRGYSINSFYNQGAGMVIDATAGDITLVGGSMDHNYKDGIQMRAYYSPGTYASRRSITGMKFLANSQSSHGTYSDISIVDQTKDLTVTGCSFMGTDTGIAVAYYINPASGSDIRVFGNSYNTVAGYVGGVFGDRSWIYGDSSDGVLQNLKVGPAPLPVYSVTTLPRPIMGTLVYVSNASGNRHLAISDGVNWRTMVGEIVTAAG